MLFLRIKVLCLALSLPLIILLSIRDASAQQTPLTPIQVERLTGMAELWSTVKYFHPYVAYRDIDWDSAMVAALPGVLEADDTESFVSAIESLLAVLDDPATYVVYSETDSIARAGSLEPVMTWTADSILVAKMNEQTLDFNDYVTVFQKMDEVKSRLGEARGIVFDTRSYAGSSGEAVGSLELFMQFAGFESALAAETLVVPGQRARMHNGFAPEIGVTSGGYSSAFYVNDSRNISADANNDPGPIVFLVNQYGQLPSVAVSLQDAGLAAIVSDGPVSDASLVGSSQIWTSEGVTIHVRTTELVHADGTTGVGANVIVSGDQVEADTDPGLEQALELVRTFEPRQVTRPKLFPSAITKKDSYSRDLYPSRPERAFAAFKVWAVIKHFFPYYDLMDEDWDAVFEESLPGIVDAADTLSFHLAIAKMYARIQDTHGFVRSPSLARYLGNAPSPLYLQWVEEQPVVVGFRDLEAAEEAGIEVGDVILEVDGMPFDERIAQVVDYYAASTPQALMRLAMGALLAGPDSSIASIKLRGKNEQFKDTQVKRLRSYYQGQTLRTNDVIQSLPGNIGYADLDRLTVPQVEDMFERFKDTRAIIFDMRGYPNGTAWSIAPYLAGESEAGAASFFRKLLLGPDEESSQKYSFIQKIPLSVPGKHYDGFTVMLIDEHTQSQAEHTGLFFAAANGTVFIGSHTSGANGDVTNFSIPGNINLTFSGHSVSYPDGRQLQRLGLVPEIDVRPTLEGLRSGRDEVLEAALNYIEEALRTE